MGKDLKISLTITNFEVQRSWSPYEKSRKIKKISKEQHNSAQEQVNTQKEKRKRTRVTKWANEQRMRKMSEQIAKTCNNIRQWYPKQRHKCRKASKRSGRSNEISKVMSNEIKNVQQMSNGMSTKNTSWAECKTIASATYSCIPEWKSIVSANFYFPLFLS